jgi:hypothetical protein
LSKLMGMRVGTGGGGATVGGSAVGFGVEVSPLWRLWGNGGSKIGPHMVFVWFGEGDAFVPKPYERVWVGLDT